MRIALLIAGFVTALAAQVPVASAYDAATIAEINRAASVLDQASDSRIVR